MNQFYLQDSRSYVGNDMVFWAQDGKGYTTDVSKAHVFSQEKALSQHRARSTDVPWPKAYIDAATRPAVDTQHTNITTALEGTGIVLRKPEKPKQETFRCQCCNSFISADNFYAGACARCGAENRP